MVAKLAFSGRMELVAEMATDMKREMRPKTLSIPFTFLYLSCTLLLDLNPEIRRLKYSGIRRYYCEGTLFSAPLGEYTVATSRLILVGFCTLL